MQLLVSVSDAVEALQALAGGADIVDAKDPFAGALGAVSSDTFGAMVRTVGGTRPVTAALGDLAHPETAARLAGTFVSAGAAFVKIGFAGVTSHHHVTAILAAARKSVEGEGPAGPPAGVIAVAYADAARAASLPPEVILDAAIEAGAPGLLIDTFDKRGPGLRDHMSASQLRAFVSRAHREGLLVALAGRLASEDLPFVRDTGADIAGVRGAACGGSRTGRVDAEQVRWLRACCSGTAV